MRQASEKEMTEGSALAARMDSEDAKCLRSLASNEQAVIRDDVGLHPSRFMGRRLGLAP